MANKAIKYIKHSAQDVIWRVYHIWVDLLMKRIRKKDKIRFLFILQELSQWKTEMLYLVMKRHPRFEPILGIAPCIEYPGAEKEVINYCKAKHYEFILLEPNVKLSKQLKVDVLAHQKPYSQGINTAHLVSKNLSIPTIYIPYYLSTITESWLVNQRNCILAWRVFLDNQYCFDDWKQIQRLHGINYSVTGLPVMDELLLPKNHWKDEWPVFDQRKRVIYAPHHTIGDRHLKGISYSTFLENGLFMLEMRDKYKDQVYFVFKPHPLLIHILTTLWGKEKAEAYYQAWNMPGVSHHEENTKYTALFQYSDALIHDCGSFTIEYMYTGNPAMYLVKDSHHKENMNQCSSKAFDLHYKGYSHEDIEHFIQSVIRGDDPLEKEREVFKEHYLTPPFAKTACQNIINSILGVEEYSKC